MNTPQKYKKVTALGVALLLLLLVACDSDGNLVIKILGTPDDFQVSTTYSADEPKLIVQVDGLETIGLEKLDYKLERFSDQCTDSDKVYEGSIPKPAKSTSFDITTEAYGAFKLSVTATYDSALYENPVKTILPPKPELELPSDDDLAGLVYIEIIDNHVQNMASQIHLDLSEDGDPLQEPENNNFQFRNNFSVQLEGLKFEEGTPFFDPPNRRGNEHRVITAINFAGAKDRKWCSLAGEDMIGKNGADSLVQDSLSVIPTNGGLHKAKQASENSLANLDLVIKTRSQPDGQRAPFVFFNLVVYKPAINPDNGRLIVERTDVHGLEYFKTGEKIFDQDFIVQDCAADISDLSEIKLDCGIDNDFPR